VRSRWATVVMLGSICLTNSRRSSLCVPLGADNTFLSQEQHTIRNAHARSQKAATVAISVLSTTMGEVNFR